MFVLITQMCAIQVFAMRACQAHANIQVCAHLQRMVTAAPGKEIITQRIIAVSIINYCWYLCIYIYTYIYIYIYNLCCTVSVVLC